MKCRPVFFILLLSLYLSASANPVSQQNAIEIGKIFLNSKSPSQKVKGGAGDISVQYTAESVQGNCFYVVGNNSGNGYVIVSADDRLPEIIGYSDSGNFTLETLPPNMKWWLEEYKHQIESFLSSPEKFRSSMPADKPAISPLITTRWNQNDPYNLLCPVDQNTGQTSVTGCVATAMAQVMKYYSHPPKAVGSREGFSFEGTTFDWGSMLDVYTSTATDTQKKAVATLMINCGMSVDMNYASSASGTQTFKVGNALTEYFGYDNSIRYNLRDYCSEEEWENLIYADLAEGHVVLYHGRTPTGGHAFVCDGYGGNGFYHFNWGWGGSQDGYFRLFILNPASGGIGSYDGGYNASQGCFTGVRPFTDADAPRQTLMVMTGYPKASASSGSTDWTVSFDDGSENGGMLKNAVAYTLPLQISFLISGKTDPSYSSVLTPFSVDLKPNYGYRSLTLRIPSGLSDGEYYICPVYRDQSSETWIKAKAPYGYPQTLVCHISGGKATVSTEVTGNVTDLLINDIVFANNNTPAKAPVCGNTVVSNIGNVDFVGNVEMHLTPVSDVEKIVWNETIPMTIPAGYSIGNEFESSFDVEPGNYLLHISSGGKTLTGSPLSLTISNDNVSGLDPKAQIRAIGVSPNFINIAEGAQLGFTVIPTSEYVSSQTGKVSMRLYRKGESTSVKSWSSSSTYTFTTTARNIRFTALDVSSLTPGYYEWQIFLGTGTSAIAISDRYPAEIYSIRSSDLSDGQSMDFQIISGKTTVCAPKMAKYSGNIILPDMVDGNPVSGLAADAFTFASGVGTISLPPTIKTIGTGQFYCADNLYGLELRGDTPPALSPHAFRPEAIETITITVPDGTANKYKRTPEWNKFKFGHWEFRIADGCRITSGLALQDDGSIYSPYYVAPEETLSFNAEAPEGKTLVISYMTSTGDSDMLKDVSVIHLPSLKGESGSVIISTENGSGVVDGIITDDEIHDVYGVDGTLILKKTSSSQIKSLAPGIYIIENKKIIIR